MRGAPLTVAEARAILRADEALDLTYEQRIAAGTLFADDERDAWIALVASANERIAAWEGVPRQSVELPGAYPGGNEADFQTLFVEAVARADAREKKS